MSFWRAGARSHFGRGFLATALLLGLGACATPDDSTTFGDDDGGVGNPGSGGNGGAGSTDSGKGDAVTDGGALCNLASCPQPPGSAAKCCAGKNVCGYIASSVCYPNKDGGGTGGKGGAGP